MSGPAPSVYRAGRQSAHSSENFLEGACNATIADIKNASAHFGSRVLELFGPTRRDAAE